MRKQTCFLVILFMLWTALPCLAQDNGFAIALAPTTMTPQRISGVTRTLLAYPEQTPAILQNYLGIDTTRIDLDQFKQIVERKNYQEIYNEVVILATHRAAFNAGSFTDVPYYKAPAQIAEIDQNNKRVPYASQQLYTGSAMIAASAAAIAAKVAIAAALF